MVDDDEHSLPPMHHTQSFFACAAVARCIIVAGEDGTLSAEVYNEALNRRIRLPRRLPGGNTYLAAMGSALSSVDYWREQSMPHNDSARPTSMLAASLHSHWYKHDALSSC